MEDTFALFARYAATALEGLVILAVCIGALDALLGIGRFLIRPSSQLTDARRGIWMGFARWLILALEFALGADVIRTAIAPSWNDVGQLAAIATIRTVLGFFLEKDIDAFDPCRPGP